MRYEQLTYSFYTNFAIMTCACGVDKTIEG